MSETGTNNLHRLHDVITLIKTDRAGSVLEALSRIFKVQMTDFESILTIVSEIAALKNRAMTEVETLPQSSRGIFKERLGILDQVINTISHLNNPMQNAVDIMDDSRMQFLKLAALQVRSNEGQIGKKDINATYQEVDDLIATFKSDNDIDNDLRNLVIETLETIKAALRSYQWTGSQAIEVAYQRLLWIWQTNPTATAKYKQTKSESNNHKFIKFQEILQTFANLATVAQVAFIAAPAVVTGINAIVPGVIPAVLLPPPNP